MSQRDTQLTVVHHAINRRTFLRSSALAIGTSLAAPAIVRGQNLNNLLNVAVIACGGRGGSNLQEMAGENVVALCDVNAKNLDAAAAQFPKAEKFVDFRKLYEKPDKFDAVVVSTSEHTHALATLPALHEKKHVYCEKPLTHNIWEARVIREAAGKVKVATQMGTQIHAGNNYRRVVELIQSGAIGPVREVHVWVSRTWGWQATEAEAKAADDIVFTSSRPTSADPIPEGLDWDLWLGPAPERAFSNVYFPGPKWYRWWEWGNGTMSDLGSHWNDLPFWALNLKYPLTVEAGGPPVHPDIAPASMWATYEYGARGDMPPLKLSWYQGKEKPQIWKDAGIPQWGDGVLFIGDDGMLLSDYGKYVLLPEEKFKDFTPPAPTIPDSIGHHQEWIQACKTGAPTTCHFEYAGWLTEANHLGNVAYRVGKKIQWDAKTLKATNAPEADKYIKLEYRKPFALEV
ncbi:MAG TPA: Gfo/Idh/MocA family oxidoreductase [Candidatus Hydrogenedentes bacterium]|nr:Gfo/Idh/MocA family oxidoreductase [Candidatus Hydrogenedentota bacterium]